MYHMSYFTVAVRDLGIPPYYRRRIRRFFLAAESARIELTNQGYELSILGEPHSLSFSFEDALGELDTALLGAPGPREGIPMAILPEPVSARVEHATRQARYALESL